MEVAVAPLCRGGQLGMLEQQQYRTLRALKSLLTLGPEKMVEKVVEMKGEGGVPPSLVLLHLFSSAPPELQSPHQVNFFIIYNLYFMLLFIFKIKL